MDARQARQQLQIIRVTMRAESSRLSPVAMSHMRARAFAILDELVQQNAADETLRDEIAALREEIS